MKFKKLAALFLVAAMGTTMLAGCGSSEEESGGTEAAADSGETDEITIALMCLSPMDESATDHVEEAINEQLEEKVNVHADIKWFDPNTYATQVPMMIQAGEDLDLMMFTPVPAAGYQSFMSQNQLMDITEYIDEYGKDIKDVMGDYLAATSKDGKIYGVGNMTSLYAAEAICMNKDTLDELGLTDKAEKMTTWSEYQDILKEVTSKTELNGVVNSDQEGSCVSPQPYINEGDSFDDAEWVDVLGDSYQYVYADPDTDEVKCYFASDEWYNNIKMAKEMYDEGLIYKDASTSQEWGESLIKNGVGFSDIKQIENGSLGSFEGSSGHKGLLKEVTTAKVATSAFQKFGFAVPVTAKSPEAAIKVLNLLYSDQEFIDTLTWGVEDVDWVKNDDGTLTYPEGVTADSVQYHTADFLYGDRLLVTPWEGDGADIRDQQKAENEKVEKSKYFGFCVDPSEVTSEITACKNVVDQYKPQLAAGIVSDVDATYKEFISALSAAGMDKIVETYQSQLDAWLAEQ